MHSNPPILMRGAKPLSGWEGVGKTQIALEYATGFGTGTRTFFGMYGLLVRGTAGRGSSQ